MKHINNNNQNLPENFCPLPWTKIELSSIGGFRPCCKYEGTLKESNGKELRHPKYSFEDVWDSGSLKELRKSS